MHRVIKTVAFLLILTASGLSNAEQMIALLTLDDAVKKVAKLAEYKVLATKTETDNSRKVFVIKVLTADGMIQYIKVDAETGEIVQ